MPQWEILAFRKSDETLAATIEGIELPLEEAQRIFSIAAENPMYDSYPIGPNEADQLTARAPIDFDFKAHDYFFERQPAAGD